MFLSKHFLNYKDNYILISLFIRSDNYELELAGSHLKKVGLVPFKTRKTGW